MKTFHCNRCQQLVFFENVLCERCNALLGYLPDVGEISAFEPADEPPEIALAAQTEQTPETATAADKRWRSLHPKAQGQLYRQCHNYAVENVCNWMIPADSPDTLCRACEFTETIPDLTVPENRFYWYKMEAAKRRLLYTLMTLGLPLESRQENPETGLEFAFLESKKDSEPVVTGHNHGRITLNIAEADDAARERARTELREPYRTLLGHFRHESGHYFFDRLVAGNPMWEAAFRERFGDERASYADALKAHYDNGPPADWAQHYISAYATMHPWEDWAETWAHYLHMVDALDTAVSYGLALLPDHPQEPELTDQTPVEEASFNNLMSRWFPLTYVLNSLNRSLGQPDGYPFTLASPVIDKLRFVHRVIAASAQKSG